MWTLGIFQKPELQLVGAGWVLKNYLISRCHLADDDESDPRNVT